jgi:glycine/D-amino acid oxidase-like deaminating enzyme
MGNVHAFDFIVVGAGMVGASMAANLAAVAAGASQRSSSSTLECARETHTINEACAARSVSDSTMSR